MIQQTSLEAYWSIGGIAGKQQEVLQTIQRLGRASNRQIAKSLGWEINRVTGRVNELVKLNKIYGADKVRDKETGRLAIRWGAL